MVSFSVKNYITRHISGPAQPNMNCCTTCKSATMLGLGLRLVSGLGLRLVLEIVIC